jgi:CRP-like cAMP-binding protein
MQLQQGDLFWGMDKSFVKKAMELATKVAFAEGDYLFHEGDRAADFYILLTGRIKLTLGKSGKVVYMARQAGEIIGWSSLTEREFYSASGRCEESASLLKIESSRFLELLSDEPTSGLTLFKRIATMLGNRLLELYPNA